MTEAKKIPPYVVSYQSEGACFYMHSNRPVKALTAQSYVAKFTTDDEFSQASISAFWIIEGYLYDLEIEGESFPGLRYYLSERDGLNMQNRWKLYNDSLDFREAGILVEAFNQTRGNAYKTEIDTPLAEKKSASRPSPSLIKKDSRKGA